VDEDRISEAKQGSGHRANIVAGVLAAWQVGMIGECDQHRIAASLTALHLTARGVSVDLGDLTEAGWRAFRWAAWVA